MGKILSERDLQKYRISEADLKKAHEMMMSFSSGGRTSSKTTIFLSHKHEDLVYLRDVIGFLKEEYDVEVYVDSRDPSMPKETSGETATRIKDVIKKSDKFILLATEEAIDSKWCNWELGYGDAQKFRENIALFPLIKSGAEALQYKGNEYMQIYPHILYEDGYQLFLDETPHFRKGYYVVYKEGGKTYYKDLKDWLK